HREHPGPAARSGGAEGAAPHPPSPPAALARQGQERGAGRLGRTGRPRRPGGGARASLVWWVFWYAGNLEVPLEELRDDVGLVPPKGSLLRGLVQGLSLRLSSAFAGPRSRAPPAGAAAAADVELQPAAASARPGAR
uniref:Uncharacterized protein n=1 Tax=Apteryx owenii TaxID=8824 RepID=A0A8B9P5I3_APTOW